MFFLNVLAQNPIKIKQIESSEQLTLNIDTTKGYIRSIDVPFEFEVVYKKPNDLWLSSSTYYFSNESKIRSVPTWMSNEIWLKTGNKYTNTYYGENHELPDTCYYEVNVIHFLQAESDIQDSLAIYYQQIKEGKGKLVKYSYIKYSNAYALPIGTLNEFKAKHPQLVGQLLRNDSISFSIRAKHSPIEMPIEY